MDEKKRKLYDQGGEQALKEGASGGGFHNPMDIFDMFFGTRSHGKGRDVGRDMVHQLKVNCKIFVGKVDVTGNIRYNLHSIILQTFVHKYGHDFNL